LIAIRDGLDAPVRPDFLQRRAGITPTCGSNWRTTLTIDFFGVSHVNSRQEWNRGQRKFQSFE
jgi:hypothetical protein